jgi:hypothetical protein
MLLFEFSRDFRIAFLSYTALLGTLLVIFGIILAGYVQSIRRRNRNRDR